MASLRDIGEFGLIAQLRTIATTGDGVVTGIGDDCAVLELGGGTILVSCDASVEEVHFSRTLATPEQIGWKCAASAISDIAAMGGRPRYLTVAIACPQDTKTEFLEKLFRGINDAATAASMHVVGGDTTCSPQGVMLDITVLGEPIDGRILLRSGARVGDLLCVTGTPGRSAAGLFALQAKIDAPELIEAHLHPEPRIAEGQWLAAREVVHAMADVSDGLVQDAGHLATASGIGLDFQPEKLTVPPALQNFEPTQGIEAIDLVMTGGEDYELIVAVDPAAQAELSREFEAAFGMPLSPIGIFTDKWNGVQIEGQDASEIGFDHFRD